MFSKVLCIQAMLLSSLLCCFCMAPVFSDPLSSGTLFALNRYSSCYGGKLTVATQATVREQCGSYTGPMAVRAGVRHGTAGSCGHGQMPKCRSHTCSHTCSQVSAAAGWM